MNIAKKHISNPKNTLTFCKYKYFKVISKQLFVFNMLTYKNSNYNLTLKVTLNQFHHINRFMNLRKQVL